ncbi:MAG: FHA domain-containing protein [Spirulinaceae cyanobacterium SM2_1_0]|nr:FHA domain-containing protein [Spirulinaceae cyanobacterium SM2_1_0]
MTGGPRRPQYETPVAFGQEFSQLPSELNGQRVSRLILADPALSPYHGVLKVNTLGELAIALRPDATAGVNGQPYTGETVTLQTGDRLQLGALELTVTMLSAPDAAEAEPARAWGVTVAPAGQSPPVAGLASQAAAGAAPSPGMPCDRLVGFLFPRRCGRTSREHCPHCQGGEIDDDPYFLASERSIYPNYGYYGGSSWGSEYTEDLTPAEAQPGEASNYDFTEADAAAFAVTSTDFEQDLDAS